MSFSIWQLGFACKIIKRRPRSAMAVVGLLGVSIGAASTMFAVLYHVVLQPLPLRRPDRMVIIQGASQPLEGDPIAWWGRCQSLEGLCFLRSGGTNLSSGGPPERVSAAAVSPDFFYVFDTIPELGRPFVAADGAPGNDRVAVLSYSLWARLFGADRSAIGRSVDLNGQLYSVVGVAPAGFEFPSHADLWVPFGNGSSSPVSGATDRADVPPSLGYTTMVGRLKDGRSVAEAESEMTVLLGQMREQYSKSGVHFGNKVTVQPLLDVFVRQYRTTILMLFAAVSFLLGIGCANAASLLLVRTASRKSEIAILLSLGARRTTIAGQLLVESVTLSIAGGVLGVVSAYLGAWIVRLWGPGRIPRLSGVRVDLMVVGFSALTSVMAGTIVGLAPIASFLSDDFMNSLGRIGRSPGGLGSRARAVAVVMEVALASVLLTGAGLCARSFLNLARVPPGFNPDKALAVGISLPWAKYGEAPATIDSSSAAQPDRRYKAEEFYGRILSRLQAVPGVSVAGAVSRLPLASPVGVCEWVGPPGGEGGFASCLDIEGDYFRAMGIPLVGGRPFRESDTRSSEPVAVVSQSFANRYFPGRNSTGQRIQIGSEKAPRTIAGVVGDVKQDTLDSEGFPEVYVAQTQPLGGRHPSLDMDLVVRTVVEPQSLAGGVADAVTSLDPGLPIFHVRTLGDLLSESLSDYRSRAILLGAFALLAALIAAAGVYGVVSYSVASRTQEIGVRMSVGAGRKDILLMIIRETAMLALTGVAIGALGATVSVHLMSGLLFGVAPMDPLTIVAAAFLLMATATCASLAPAISASRTEPAAALRYE
ncbi:MAG TPA: ABC transporter permease [Blastocatellia bacterium]